VLPEGFRLRSIFSAIRQEPVVLELSFSRKVAVDRLLEIKFVSSIEDS